MANLSLYLLGPTRVKLDESYIEIKPRKALALLIYLAVTAEPHSRDSLATMLWPNSDQQRARHSLRSRLSELNLILRNNWIEASRESVSLRSGFWLDVLEFQRKLAENSTDLQSLIAAVDLYRDDFLTGFTLPDSPEFDEWQFFLSENLRQALASALEKLVGILSDLGEYETAVPYARRRLALDPLHEPACRQLMQLYARAGKQAAALRQYDLCRDALEEDLGLSPSQETTALFNDIKANKVAKRAFKPRPLHNLPTQTTTFIGREAELAEIKRLLLHESGCRLVTLVGPGGIGKTRLALSAAAQTLETFLDGVYFVSLAPVGEVGDIIPAVAEALRFAFFGQADPKDQLLDYLSQKQMLLVVDNLEHLIDGAGLLFDVLRAAPNVTFLVTSRERLNYQEEWVYAVLGLPFPIENSQTSEVLSSYSAVELFTQRARQTVTNFTPSTVDMANIGRICQLVEGMPLGLELAAPWIKVLSCREIADKIKSSLDFLTTDLQNVPQRHRSLRIVFEQTWERLSPAEKTVLQQLSIFRGGCTREGAEQVTGATLPVLSSLVDKALLRRSNTGRLEMHELIRQFAEEQLQSDPHTVDQIRQRHYHYFMTFLEVRTASVIGHRQFETLTEIEADMDNVRLAWRRAVAIHDSEAIEGSAECLFVYYLYRNGYDEGLIEFRRASAAFALPPNSSIDDGWPKELAVQIEMRNLVGFLLAGQGYFLAHRRNLQKGQILLEQALVLLDQKEPGDSHNKAFALLWLGWALLFQGRLIEAKRYARECLALIDNAEYHWFEAWALLLLGASLRYGRPAEASGILQKGLKISREKGDQFVLSYLSKNLGDMSISLGRYAQAKEYIDITVTISENRDNILGLGYSLFSRGHLEIRQGQYRQAIQTLQQSLTYFNRVGTVHASRAQIYLGLAYHLHGDFDLAALQYGQALEGLKAANSQFEVSTCLNYLGTLSYDRGNLHQAEQYQRDSLALLQETEQEPALVASTLRYLGRVLVALGEDRLAEARDCFRQVLDLTLAYQLAPIALDVYVDIAHLLVHAGIVELAVELLTLAEQHEASTFETRERARPKLAELTDKLPVETAQSTQGQTQDLWAATRELLAGMASGSGAL